MKNIYTILLITFFFGINQPKAQELNQTLDSLSVDGLKWRSVGPAFTSGRVSDIAVNPKNPFEYYIATSSGGVWKTINSGVTYTPIFDSEGSYSIGCVTIDPNNPNVIWVGTGENNNQRSVAYGDGIYKSEDGGKTWKNMGLKTSEHIGKIIIHPDDSNIIFVAAIGPLWNKGGERGLYKSVDGGETWKAVLSIDEHTGVNDVVMDTRNPDVLYASALQRRRHVFTYVGGGPGSGLYKSVDGGESWNKINKGLPKTELGRIGLTISPANPEIIYAIVEAADGKSGFYASINRGASWEKRGKHSTSGNYYQEIIADPIDENTIYSMDTWMSVSKDGGKTFNKVGETYKHVDNHCMWINPSNNKHWLVGCDGGIYETFDAAKTWDFKENLPVTQFYKVAVDNDTPFYNIYGGTQDNFSIGGPSRVLTDHGITNQDWFITNGGDGFESQVDPNNPNIVYAQSQYGFLVRYDKLSGETAGIQPKERENENAYRFNWDSPLVVSRHVSGRLYFAANKLFRSDDYGNSWEVISEDLSRQIDRNKLKVYDRIISVDAVAKNGSTSLYGSIVALSESPINKNLIAVGTDDGLIHVSEDGGENWNKISNIKGAPNRSYINSVYLSKHNENVIYAAFNHHKYGDFKPYIFKSEDKGKSWIKISNNLPVRGSVYAIEEDHVDSNLIFCGTEFGAFFSPNKGKSWRQLKKGLPTIAVRDIAIQERENDLVLGTFGRGFYVLDDYTPLRGVASKLPNKVATIFPVRDALLWEKSMPLGLPGKAFQGDNFFSAENLGPEAIISYYYNDTYKSLKEKRTKREKASIKNNEDVLYPNYESLKSEKEEKQQQLVFTIKDFNGAVVKKHITKPKKGIQRFQWNLRYTSLNPIKLKKPKFYNPFQSKDEGTLVEPGVYTVELDLFNGNSFKKLVEPTSFKVNALNNTVMPATDRNAKVEFQRKVAKLSADLAISIAIIKESENKLKHIKVAVEKAETTFSEFYTEIQTIENNLKANKHKLNGDPIKTKLDIGQPQTTANRIGIMSFEQKYTTSPPTKTHMDNYAIAHKQLNGIKKSLENIFNVSIKNLEDRLVKFGAPYTPGRGSDD